MPLAVCGRYTLAANADELVEAFEVPPLAFDWSPRYNIAPGQLAPIVAADRRGRRMGLLTWGLLPSWAEPDAKALINARSESVLVKPSFREAFERRRCLVPADGFYEWTRDGRARVPHWFFPRGGGLLSFAGIWERWSRPGAESRHTFAILTTEASEDVAAVHDRMPVVVGEADRVRWLDAKTPLRDLGDLLRPMSRGSLERRRVSSRVNRVAHDDHGLIGVEAGGGVVADRS